MPVHTTTSNKHTGLGLGLAHVCMLYRWRSIQWYGVKHRATNKDNQETVKDRVLKSQTSVISGPWALEGCGSFTSQRIALYQACSFGDDNEDDEYEDCRRTPVEAKGPCAWLVKRLVPPPRPKTLTVVAAALEWRTLMALTGPGPSGLSHDLTRAS